MKPFNIDVIIIEPGIIETEFDDVLVGPLMKQSGDGPYAPLARAVASATERTHADGSDPSVVSEVILRAIESERPKTRYAVGKRAGLFIFLRKCLGDRLFDRIVMSQV